MPTTAIRIAVIAALCAAPTVLFAQMSPAPSAAATQPSSAAPSASTGAAANTNATATAAPTASLAAGLTVKDNTGTAIGKVAEVKPDATGKSMVTIQMGTRNFQVPATVLALDSSAATINLTKAQIEAQLPKK